MFLTVNKIRNFTENPNTNTNFYHNKNKVFPRIRSDKTFMYLILI